MLSNGKPHQSSSHGPASRGNGAGPSSNSINVGHQGFMSGGSKGKHGSHSTSGGLHSTKPSFSGGLNSTKGSHLARIPNASVISAAPASHPPVLAQYGQ